MKLGLPPFHSWIIDTVTGANTLACVWLLAVVKLIPILLLGIAHTRVLLGAFLVVLSVCYLAMRAELSLLLVCVGWSTIG